MSAPKPRWVQAGLALTFCSISAAFATAPAFAQRITVSTNALVSGDRPGFEHGEPVICAHLTDPDVLIAAASSPGDNLGRVSDETPRNSGYGEIVYWSADGGESWHYGMDTFGEGWASPDPSCAFSPDGSAHFGTMMVPDTAPRVDLDMRLLDYRSTDGGQTWEDPVWLEGVTGADRQWQIFDNTDGRYHGWEYMSYFGAFRMCNLAGEPTCCRMGLSRSRDGGKSWEPPIIREANGGVHNGNLAVLSDGTVLGVIGQRRDSLPPVLLPTGQRRPAVVVSVLRWEDGGEFFSQPLEPITKVADMFMGPGTGVHYINAIAVDASPAYEDRLYVVWNDDRSGRMQPVLSYSSDRGYNWTNPRTVSDDPPFDAANPSKGPHATAPWIAVNNDGVVGVVWLDRRGMTNNIGYHVRFSASLDGGETWLPSVRVSEEPMVPRAIWRQPPHFHSEVPNPDTLTFSLGWDRWDHTGGDCIGLDVDAVGNFHPVWVDARTGVRQVYTAMVTVRGTVQPGRRIVTQSMVPITRSIALELEQESHVFDEIAGTVSVEARLVNRGEERVRGPIVARVVKLSTVMAAEVRVANSDNQQTSIGAAWDFSPLLPDGELEPGARTGAKRLLFRLLDLQPFEPWKMQTSSFVDVSVEILASGSR